MKKSIITATFFISSICSFSQITETDEKVGIGTTNPKDLLQVGEHNTGKENNIAIWTSGNGAGEQAKLRFKMFVSGGVSNSTIAEIVPYTYVNSGLNRLDFRIGAWNNNNSAGSSKLSILSNGKIGIGTTSPMTSLDVYGTTGIRISNADPSNNKTYLYMGGHSNNFLGKSAIISVPNAAGWFRQDLHFALANGNDNNSVTTSDVAMTIKSYVGSGKFGYVGIGTTNPEYRLDVIGTIRAREIKVDLDGADFVFDDNYSLRTLEEVERFIKENKHLPEIEPANEMETDGTELGALNTKFLQKIEELTLYMIEQNKEIKELKEEIKNLKETAE